ncbi:MAG TPA: Crp/Fnr family transcriptional regulator [Gammaproteobacteria bacterium]|nr:Crp/Fnr family transcriptional regulator [Gammaproteobacteria bacterium]
MPVLHSKDIDHILNQQYFVAGLDAQQRERLLETASFRQLDTGKHVFRRSDTASFFYVLISGRLKLYRLSADGDEKIMNILNPGTSFAEGVLFMETPRYPLNAQMLESGLVIGLHRDTYLDILRNSFPACLSVMARVTNRIQGLLDEIESVTLRDSRYRVINFLVRLLPTDVSHATHIELPARKSTIAARLSIRPETLSRMFKVLDNEGLIEMQENRIVIPDPDALRRIVQI